jgi:hypothetical protein
LKRPLSTQHTGLRLARAQDKLNYPHQPLLIFNGKTPEEHCYKDKDKDKIEGPYKETRTYKETTSTR